jgi:hypothetical protein
MSPSEIEEKIQSLRDLLVTLQLPIDGLDFVDEEERGLVGASNISEPANAPEKINF